MPDDLFDPAPPTRTSASPIIRDFIIDVLGSLVPGMLFSMAAGAVFLLAALYSSLAIAEVIDPGYKLTPEFNVLFQLLTYERLIFLLVVSFVIGHMFFRKDPKGPDLQSAVYLLKKIPVGGPNDMAVRHGDGGKPPDVQYPYSHLYEYLLHRGLEEIAALVPWRGGDPDTKDRRTKMFINMIKIRLQFLVPDKCADITRNEAHIRLMSSVWYAARTLPWVILIHAPVVCLAAVILLANNKPLHLGHLCAIVVTYTGLIGLSVWIQWTIRKFFHYQRVREIVYVLATAAFAEKVGYKVLIGLLPPPSSAPQKEEAQSPRPPA